MLPAFTMPWSGPGNSEGGPPEDPPGVWGGPAGEIASPDDVGPEPLMTDPWPGPGNSDG
jgi:hypothetical protein